MPLAQSYRALVREIAKDSYGFVTTRDAVDAGVPAVELPKLAARGGLTHVAYGLYRVDDVPPTPNDQYAEALLRLGEGAFLRGESVLALHGLADVNPRRIQVAVRRRTRSKVPPFIHVTFASDDVQVTYHEGLWTQTVHDAIKECRGRVEASRLMEAADQARVQGLLTAPEWTDLAKELAA